MRVLTVVGTRPEIIRLSRIIPTLDDLCDHTLIHTGQNYDPTLSDIFFSDLRLRPPDEYMNCDTSSVGAFLGDAFAKFEKLLREVQPQAVLILGDTNSGLVTFIAKRMGISVIHMEAGNRSFDANVPEEMNRKVIDHFADINLVYSEHARRNLLAEGLHPQRIYLTGSPLREVLDYYRKDIDGSSILKRLDVQSDDYFLLSLHREENVDDPSRLHTLVQAVHRLAQEWDTPVVASLHPRTRKRLEHRVMPSTIQFLEPFGFFDYVHLQQHARCVVSDSGTISEESAMLNFPAISPRDSMERPEAMDAGTIVLSGITAEGISESVFAALHTFPAASSVPDAYTVRDCSQRVARIILSLPRVQPIWDNRRSRADG